MNKPKKTLALFLAMLITILSMGTVSAADIPKIRFTVLGDSIASGYGLNNLHDCYAALVSAEKSYYLTNSAVPGQTTDGLLWTVCSNDDAIADIKSADLIAISTCGNDLLRLLSKATSADLADIMLNGVEAESVRKATEEIRFNLESVCTELRLLNSDAPIIFQNLYNPLYSSEKYSAYAPLAEELSPVLDEIFAQLCNDFPMVYTIDVHGAFDSYYEENNNYDVIASDGIHPTESGHALIAEVLLNKINELEKEGLVPVAAEYYYLLGDADGNGKITISDATTIQKIVAGLLTVMGDIAQVCPDADENGTVNIKDATIIQKHLASLPSNPNIGTYLPFYDY